MSAYQLNEPVIDAVVARLNANMAAQVAAVNAGVTDGYTILAPAAVLDYLPPVAQLVNFPTLAIRDGRGTFEDDLAYSATGRHELSIVCFLTDPDPRGLAWRLRRTAQAVVTVVLAARNLASGAWGAGLVDITPGPTLGDATNPTQVQEWMSWTEVRIWAKREEA